MIDWDSVLVGSLNDQFSLFERKIKSTYYNCFPLKVKYISVKRFKNRWLSAGILKSIKTKSTLFKMFKLGNITKSYLNTYCNKLKSITNIAKKSYYSSAFVNNRNNMHKTWGLMQELSGKNVNLLPLRI